jgi:hypothetical protein
MILELRTIEDYNLAEIVIVDLDNITIGHAVKYTLPSMKKLEICATVSFYQRKIAYPTPCPLTERYSLRICFWLTVETYDLGEK